MKNLKNLDRNELKTVLGGAAAVCLVPVDGGFCPANYTFCSNPYCCYPPRRPYICMD
ncbi:MULTISPECIES: bacteriocin-like protein [Chryseobacterium]|uniref:bacteriocin-like protein n=1 Tax=Chryseobacterium TaxID=59732 RepID=UPI000FA7C876|nr:MULTISPECIES: hypothetical protein [Chryseobacterium]MCS4303017.1 hypothetical protein [Chryseobacterium sp. BIGb0232]ROS14691.1 hypothetical protein EDF65_3474 [Chryseobacterium nakagawai]